MNLSAMDKKDCDIVVPLETASHAANSIGQTPPNETGVVTKPLTKREGEVLRLIAEGETTKEIGQLLQISFKTAVAHRTNIMTKLDIHNLAGLVRYAIRRKIIQP